MSTRTPTPGDVLVPITDKFWRRASHIDSVSVVGANVTYPNIWIIRVEMRDSEFCAIACGTEEEARRRAAAIVSAVNGVTVDADSKPFRVALGKLRELADDLDRDCTEYSLRYEERVRGILERLESELLSGEGGVRTRADDKPSRFRCMELNGDVFVQWFSSDGVWASVGGHDRVAWDDGRPSEPGWYWTWDGSILVPRKVTAVAYLVGGEASWTAVKWGPRIIQPSPPTGDDS